MPELPVNILQGLKLELVSGNELEQLMTMAIIGNLELENTLEKETLQIIQQTWQLLGRSVL